MKSCAVQSDAIECRGICGSIQFQLCPGASGLLGQLVHTVFNIGGILIPPLRISFCPLRYFLPRHGVYRRAIFRKANTAADLLMQVSLRYFAVNYVSVFVQLFRSFSGYM